MSAIVYDWRGPATRERPGPWLTPLEGANMADRICTVEACSRPLSARGVCSMHYRRIRRHGDPHKVIRGTVAIPVIERVLRRVVEDSSGCWLWPGALINGYGQVSKVVNGRHRNVMVHRVTYEYFIGEIPPGLQIDHLCRVRNCCNPAHLEVVTAQENALRRWQAYRLAS